MARFNHTLAVEELQTFRTTNERKSERVAALGARLIRDKYMMKLGDEAWQVYEQIAIAALDIHDLELANHCITKLKERFGETSMRFRRLLGMQLEAENKLQEAQEVYDKILQEDDANVLASKRQIALLRLRGKDAEAVEALTKYVETYYDDHEGWAELCDLYLAQHHYEQAAFCCEELIILQPANHIWYLKYAEILYTMKQLPLALKHYCKVLELCTDHVRALYGLELCASKLVGSSQNEHAPDLHALAVERLTKIYGKKPDTIRQLVQEYLSTQ